MLADRPSGESTDDHMVAEAVNQSSRSDHDSKKLPQEPGLLTGQSSVRSVDSSHRLFDNL
jgi:hypothetical protein